MIHDLKKYYYFDNEVPTFSILAGDFLNITYRFRFENGSEKIFPITINDDTLKFISTISEPAAWTKKENINCPMGNDSCENFCPIALNLDTAIKFFDGFFSYEKVFITVETEQRTYTKQTSLQDGVGSLLGILMTTSGCHVLDKLRPLVRFHLPFASLEETEFRVFGMYLFSQFLRMKKGLDADWEMNSLKQMYADIMKINKNIAKKISDLEKLDASINAVVILNNFANMVSFDLEDDDFTKFEKLFEPWLK